MVKNALGLIETVGLAAALEAADAAVKAANVELMGYELTKGGGMVVIKLCGDVGAVKAAVDAGSAASAKINKVVAKHVIPRPHNELGPIVMSRETVGYKPSQPAPAADVSPVKQIASPDPATSPQPVAESAETASESTLIEMVPEPVQAPFKETEQAVKQEAQNLSECCNLCGDPACPRKKGDPRVTCIHYDNDKNNKEDE